MLLAESRSWALKGFQKSVEKGLNNLGLDAGEGGPGRGDGRGPPATRVEGSTPLIDRLEELLEEQEPGRA